MHKHYIDKLICPKCHGNLEWNIQEETEERIVNASIVCTECESKYEVRDEIAVFLTSDLSRNDLWETGESGLEKLFRENPDIYEKLFNMPEDKLNGADYWFKASYYEMKGNYDLSTAMFDKAFNKVYTQDYINGWESQQEYVIKNVDETDKTVVDIASGKGYLVEKILKATNNYVIATDFSPTILKRDKEYFKFKGVYDRVSLIAFDARRTPFKDNSIEVMTSNMGIQNIENPGEVIKEMYRINGGTFMSVMQFIDENDKTHMELFEKYASTAYATKRNATEVFEGEGFKVLVENCFMADIKPTPVGEIIEGAGIDGFPVQDTKVEYAVIVAEK